MEKGQIIPVCTTAFCAFGKLCQVWFQTDFGAYEELSELMSDFDASHSELLSDVNGVVEGNVYIAKYHGDGAWYRGLVKSIDQATGSVTVFFMDYGNTEVLSFNDLMKPVPKYFALPQLASSLILADIGPNNGVSWTEYEIERLNGELSNLELNAEILQKSCASFPPVARLLENQEPVITRITNAGIGKQSRTYLSQTLVEHVQCDKGKQAHVYVTDVESPLNFWIQLVDGEAHLDNLHEMITAQSESLKSLNQFEPGMMCLALYSETQSFYRAVINRIISPSQVQVSFIDYGNSELVSSDYIRDLPEQFCSLPAMAVHCSMQGAALANNFTEFSKIVECENVSARVLRILPSGLHVVDLSSDVERSSDSKASVALDKSIYTMLEFDLPSVHDVCISKVQSSGLFYCQLMKAAKKLDNLMLQLQMSQRSIITHPDSGVPCLALSPKDKLLYRAQIIEVNAATCKVELVDFGEIENIISSSLFAIDPQYMQMPKQSFLCRVSRVNAAADRVVQVLSQYESKMPLLAQIVEQSNGVYEAELVDLSNGEVNVKSIIEGQSTVQECQISLQEPDVQLQTKEKIIVTNVMSDSKFFGQLAKYPVESLETLSTAMMAYYTPNKVTPLKTIRCGSFCAVQSSEDNHFYRAEVIEKCGAESWKVFLVDYGFTETKLSSSLLELRQEFRRLPIQGIGCCLAKKYSGIDQSVLEEKIMDSEIIVELEENVASFYEVTLPNCKENGMLGDLMEELSMERMNYSHTQVPIGAKQGVIVSHIDDQNHVFCQLLSNQDDLSELMEQITVYVQQGSAPVGRIAVGQPVLAKYSADDQWYRASVKGLSPEGCAEVMFVDFGNGETIQRGSLCQPSGHLMSAPAFAIPCAMEGVQRQAWSSDKIDKLWTDLDGNLTANFHSVSHNVYSVTFYKGQSNINSSYGQGSRTPSSLPKVIQSVKQNAIDSGTTWAKGFEASRNHLDADDAGKSMPGFKTLDLPRNKYQDWQLAYSINPGKFWCQLQKNTEQLDDMMEEITYIYKALSAGQLQIATPLTVGMACCAQFSDDEHSWYRAVIQEIRTGKVNVRFVDYGNSEDKDVGSLKALAPKYMELPIQAFQCSLAGCKPVSGSWDAEATKLFESLTNEKSIVGAVIDERSGGGYGVELIAEDVLVHEELVKTGKAAEVVEGHAVVLPSQLSSQQISTSTGSGNQTSQPEPSTAELKFVPISITPGQFLDFSVVYVDSPSSFWCQPVEQSPRLQHLMERLNEVYSKLSAGDLIPQSFEIGQPCCCKFSDQNWYRIQIAAVDSCRVQAKFVDYGNEEWYDKSEIRQLRKAFMELPVQAIECSLAHVRPLHNDWSDPAIDKFDEVTADKNLVAKIVSVTDGKCEVELVDESQSPRVEVHQEMIKLRFATAKSSTKQHHSSSPSLKTAIQSKEPQRRADPLAQRSLRQLSQEEEIEWQPYTRVELAMDSFHKAVTSWINSPSDFYIQMQEAEKELERLTEELFECYQSVRLSKLAIHSPVVGQSCVAYYEADGNWYRSTIVEVSGKEANVQYIDYGNSQKVPLVKVKQIKPEFACFPAHAIHCSLLGSDDKVGKWHPIELKSFDAFMTGNLQCQVVGRTVNGYIMDITTEQGVSLSHELGLVKLPQVVSPSEFPMPLKSILKVKSPHQQHGPSSATRVEQSPPKTLPTAKTSPSSKASPSAVERTLLNVGSRIAVQVANVTSLSSFDCHLSKDVQALESFQIKLESAYSTPSSAAAVSKTDLVPGYRCCAKDSDNYWYRAIILEVPTASEAMVKFIDYGNTSRVQRSQIKKLLPSFETIPAFAIECSLKNADSFCADALEKFNELAVGKEVLAVVLDKNDDKFSIDLTSKESGSVAEKLSELFSGQKPAGPVPQESDRVGVYVSAVESPAKFYLQRDADSEKLAELEESLSEEYSNLEETEQCISDLDAGMLCCAQASDEAWYRAQVLKTADSSVSVLFVDYGNSEDVIPGNLRLLTEAVAAMKPLAFECQLRGCRAGEWSDDNVASFSKQVQVGEKLLQAKIWTDEVPSCVSLYDDNGREIGLDFVQGDVFAPKGAPKDEVSVFITHVLSPSHIYVQLTDEAESLEKVTEALQEPAGHELALTKIEQGCAYCCQFSEDNAWYRVEIISVEKNLVTVRYVDFGNTELRERIYLRQLPPQLLKEPPFAIECIVQDMEKPSNGWSSDAAQVFEEFVADKEITANFAGDIKPYAVVLTEDGMSIAPRYSASVNINADVKVEQNDEVKQDEVMAYLNTVVPDGRCQVFVSHIESTTDFYLQLSKDSLALEQLVDSVDERYASMGDNDNLITNPSPNQPCCAKHAGVWYRAVVKEVHDENTATVRFVDYGNSEKQPITSLKRMTVDLAKLPCQAFKCRLLGADDDKVTDEVVEKFQEIAMEKILSADIIEGDVCDTVLWEKDDCINKIVLGEDVVLSVPHHTTETATAVTDAAKVSKTAAEMLQPGEQPEDTQQIPCVDGNSDEFVEVSKQDLKSKEAPLFIWPSLVKPVCSQLAIGVKVEASVVFSSSPYDFWCHLTSRQHELDLFMAKLKEECEGASPCEETPSCGQILCARFSEDGEWYRARVDSSGEDGVSVFFLDYGNSAVVERTELIKLPESLTALPSQCFFCSLVGVQPVNGAESWNEESCEAFEDMVMDKKLLLEVKEVGQDDSNGVKVLLRDMGVSVSAKLIQHELAQALAHDVDMNLANDSEVSDDSSDDDTVIHNFADSALLSSIRSQSKHQVYISHVKSLKEFWVQHKDHEMALCSLEESMLEYYDNVTESDLVVSPGSCYAVKSTEDDKWYRSQVISEQDGSFDMLYLDYGNRETVDITRIRSLRKKFAALEKQAICCQLEGVDDLNEEVSFDLFLETTADKSLLMHILGGDSERLSVNLFDMGMSVAKTVAEGLGRESGDQDGQTDMVALTGHDQNVLTMEGACDVQKPDSVTELDQENEAEKRPSETVCSQEDNTHHCMVQPTTASYKCLELEVGHNLHMHVTNVISASDFWCQPAQSSSTQLPLLNEQIHHHYSMLEPDSSFVEFPQPGLPCVARYSEEVWYRAIVTDVKDGWVEVCFVDYGKSQNVPSWEVKVVREEFVDIPMQALHCTLDDIMPLNNGMWDDESRSRFLELVGDENKEFNVEVRGITSGSGRPNIISVCVKDGEVDIGDELVSGGYAQKAVNKLTPLSVSDQYLQEEFKSNVKNVVNNIIKNACAEVEAKEKEGLKTVTKINHIDLDVEAEIKVVHASGDSPNKFAVQLIYTVPELEELMDEIACAKGRGLTSEQHAPQQQIDQLKTGDCCLVCDEDDLWYRGEILDINDNSMLYTVNLVDYGRQVEVNRDHIDALQARFADLSAQAIWCCLDNKDKPQFEELMASSDFVLMVLSRDEDHIHQVTADHGGDEIGDAMVQHMLEVSLNASHYADEFSDDFNESEEQVASIAANESPCADSTSSEKPTEAQEVAAETIDGLLESACDKNKCADITSSEKPTEAQEVAAEAISSLLESVADKNHAYGKSYVKPAESKELAAETIDGLLESACDKNKCADITSSEKPTEANEVEKPTEANKVEKPEEANEVEKPTEANEVEKPEESNEVEKPTEAHEVESETIDCLSESLSDANQRTDSKSSVKLTVAEEVVAETISSLLDSASGQDKKAENGVNSNTLVTEDPQDPTANNLHEVEDEDSKIHLVALGDDEMLDKEDMEDIENSFIEVSVCHEDSLGDLCDDSHVVSNDESSYRFLRYCAGDTVDVLISSASDPDSIVCHVASYKDQFNQLYTKLSSAMTTDIPTLTELETGQACCVQFSQHAAGWGRGQVKSLLDGDKVSVYNVDYGYTQTVSRSQVKLLPTDFLSLPAQALPCRLSGVAPLDESWTQEVGEAVMSWSKADCDEDAVIATAFVVLAPDDASLIISLHNSQKGDLAGKLIKENFVGKKDML